jgi:hypothetical protein
MMPQKTVFVLANSIKKQQRCVAGRELFRDSHGEQCWGGWIRPVTHHDEGAISLVECRLQDGTTPVPFDVIQIPTTSNENSPTQPENWYIQQSAQWRKTATWSREEAEELIETPKNLWLERGVKQDRVTPQYLVSRKDHQSLYLIMPKNFYFSVKVDVWEGEKKKRIRGVFTYETQTYDFSVTDPIASQKYFPNWSSVPSGRTELKQNSNLLICVSLTPEFNGYHYKVVATVIEG